MFERIFFPCEVTRGREGVCLDTPVRPEGSKGDESMGHLGNCGPFNLQIIRPFDQLREEAY